MTRKRLAKGSLHSAGGWPLALAVVLLVLATGTDQAQPEQEYVTIKPQVRHTGVHRQLFEDEDAREPSACYTEAYSSWRCTESERVRPPKFYRMLWLDETPLANLTTGFWCGNAITLKYSINKEFLVLGRFEKNEDVVVKPFFMATHTSRFGVEKLRHYNPGGGNFFLPVNGSRAYEKFRPRILFNYYKIPFQMNVLNADQILDEPPGVDEKPPALELDPKCYALRFLIYRGGLDTEHFEFKKTPVTIYKQLNENDRMITRAKVNKHQDSFFYYHNAMPIMCDDKLSYLIKTDLDDKRSTKDVEIISIYFVMDKLYKTTAKSIYKTLDGVPAPESKVAFIRFG